MELKDVRADLDSLSDRISTQVRTLSIGILAMTWLFLSKDKSVAQLPISGHEIQLAFIALFAILAIAVDLFQYAVGYFYTSSLYRSAESSGAATITYNKKHWAYRARECCFRTKQVLVVVAALWLVGLLSLSIFGAAIPSPNAHELGAACSANAADALTSSTSFPYITDGEQVVSRLHVPRCYKWLP